MQIIPGLSNHVGRMIDRFENQVATVQEASSRIQASAQTLETQIRQLNEGAAGRPSASADRLQSTHGADRIGESNQGTDARLLHAVASEDRGSSARIGSNVTDRNPFDRSRPPDRLVRIGSLANDTPSTDRPRLGRDLSYDFPLPTHRVLDPSVRRRDTSESYRFLTNRAAPPSTEVPSAAEVASAVERPSGEFASETRAAAAIRADTPVERELRAQHQLTGAFALHERIGERLSNATYNHADLRDYAQSQAETLYHLLNQNLSAPMGIATDERTAEIHRTTGSLALLADYLPSRHSSVEAASTLHHTHGERLAAIREQLQSAETRDDGIANLQELFGSGEPRLQTTADRFAYHLVELYREGAPAIATSARPAFRSNIQMDGEMPNFFSRSRAAINTPVVESMLGLIAPAYHFMVETSAANVRANIAALDRGDTAGLREQLTRANNLLTRLAGPLEQQIHTQDLHREILRGVMSLPPAERMVTLQRLTTEARDAARAHNELNESIRELPVDVLRHLANSLR